MGSWAPALADSGAEVESDVLLEEPASTAGSPATSTGRDLGCLPLGPMTGFNRADSTKAKDNYNRDIYFPTVSDREGGNIIIRYAKKITLVRKIF